MRFVCFCIWFVLGSILFVVQVFLFCYLCVLFDWRFAFGFFLLLVSVAAVRISTLVIACMIFWIVGDYVRVLRIIRDCFSFHFGFSRTTWCLG